MCLCVHSVCLNPLVQGSVRTPDVRVCVCVSVSVSVYGPFYRSGAKTGWKYFEILYVLVPKLCPYIYCTIFKVHIYLVNEPSNFILYFHNV